MPKPSSRRAAPQKGPCSLTSAESKLLARTVAAGDAGAPIPEGSGAAQALEGRDLAEIRDGRICATAAGRARVRRESSGDEGFVAQHMALERRSLLTERGYEDLLVDLDESPLAWLARRKGRDGKPLLSPAEVAAGEKLRADFTCGQMAPRVTANWEAAVSSGRRGGGGSPAEMADAVLAARMRVSRAVEAVGPELSGALLDVCCFLKGLEEVERDRGWPARGAKLVLGLGLARLARHYGLVRVPSGATRPIVSWGTPDSRPSIDGAKPS